MNDIQKFTNDEFGTIRTVEEDGNVLFCGSDVARALGYKRPNDALKQHCRSGATAFHRPIVDQLGREQQARFITEGDLYRLIASSKLPSAQQFESWVFDEVLPSIRKQGGYMTARADETPEEIMARALMLAKDTMDRQQREIAELRPKALFADAVAASDGTCLIGELAKMMRQNGVHVGQNRLFEWLRRDGFLGKTGSNYNVPTQMAMERGLFRIKETAVTHSDGHVTVNRTPKATGKGQRYFIDRYCKA
jgi:prophage antirepressor-like protein